MFLSRGGDAVSCTPDHEKQAKNAKIDSDKIAAALKALEDCPHVDIDFKSVDVVIGGLYRSKVRADRRFEEATEKLRNT